MKKRGLAVVLCICILTGMAAGCTAKERKDKVSRNEKEITIAVNSETGGLDPA